MHTRRVTTRCLEEVQDTKTELFAEKLKKVFLECKRVMRDQGLLVFSYHHSKESGWTAVAEAVLGAGFSIVQSQPVKSEMSVATPKSQARHPIDLDVLIVCRKRGCGFAQAANQRGLTQGNEASLPGPHQSVQRRRAEVVTQRREGRILKSVVGGVKPRQGSRQDTQQSWFTANENRPVDRKCMAHPNSAISTCRGGTRHRPRAAPAASVGSRF